MGPTPVLGCRRGWLGADGVVWLWGVWASLMLCGQTTWFSQTLKSVWIWILSWKVFWFFNLPWKLTILENWQSYDLSLTFPCDLWVKLSLPYFRASIVSSWTSRRQWCLPTRVQTPTQGEIKKSCRFTGFVTLNLTKQKYVFIFYSCWQFGNARSQGISSNAMVIWYWPISYPGIFQHQKD